MTALSTEPAPTATRTKTMKAIVKTTAAPGAEIRDVPVPTPGTGEVLLRVLRAGVCGTDLHICNWDRCRRAASSRRSRSAMSSSARSSSSDPVRPVSRSAIASRVRATSCATPASRAAPMAT